MPGSAEGLLERDGELAAAHVAIERLLAGRGGRLLIEGPPGIGKSALLEAVRERARRAGILSLEAEASEMASRVAFGVARAVLGAGWPEPAPRSGEPTGPDTGRALLARAVAAVLRLSEREPVLVSVDDVQWADPASLRWLALLASRAPSERVALVLVAGDEAPASAAAMLGELLNERGALVIRPAALSVAAAGVLLSRRSGGELDPALVGACHQDTSGNPYFLRALADALGQTGVPTGEHARRRLREIGSRAVARGVTARLDRLDPGERALIEAAAAVGDLGGIAALADFVGVDADTAAAAGSRLIERDLLRGTDPVELAHPLLGSAIRSQMEAAHREALLRRAADRLAAAGAVEEAAARLIELPARGDPDVARILADAAAHAAARGAADVSVPLLRRALGEPPAAAERPAVEAALGRTLVSLADPDAVAVLERALAGSPPGPGLAALAADLALALNYARRTEDAIGVLERACDRLHPDHPALAEELEAVSLNYMVLMPGMRPRLRERLEQWGERRGASELAFRQRLAQRATQSLIAPAPAVDTIALAERALAGGVLLSADTGPAHNAAAVTLAYAGRPQTARARLQDFLAQARARNDTVKVGLALAIRGEVRRLEGDMLGAEIDIRTGLDLLPDAELGPPFMLRGLIESLVAQGRVADAEAQLRHGALTGKLPDLMPTPGLLLARASVRTAAGSVAQAVEDLLQAGEVAERLGLEDPVSVPWRLAAAEGLIALDDRRQAARLVDEQLERATRTRLSEAIGASLRVRGLLAGPRAGLPVLQEAADRLRGGFLALESARAHIDLGTALAESDRAGARAALQFGATLAEQLGATVLAARAVAGLITAGGRPRRAARSGAHSLTPGERRTARLAAEGMTNREIAERLVVSEKTVSSQLGSAFRKLAIRSRAQLPDALARAEPSGSGDPTSGEISGARQVEPQPSSP